MLEISEHDVAMPDYFPYMYYYSSFYLENPEYRRSIPVGRELAGNYINIHGVLSTFNILKCVLCVAEKR